MQSSLKQWTRKIRSMVPGLLLAATLIFPPSSSVLCVAPGHHIAIEDADAPCCTSSGISHFAETRANSEFSEQSHCKHCMDFYLGSTVSGLLPQINNPLTTNIFTVECVETGAAADASLSPLSSGKIGIASVSLPVSSSIPLRC
jgi:hypothetical protein